MCTTAGPVLLDKDSLKSFWYLNNYRFKFQRKRLLCHAEVFFFLCFFFSSMLSESGANSYESGIMVSKAVEIQVDGKLLKPAGKTEWC